MATCYIAHQSLDSSVGPVVHAAFPDRSRADPLCGPGKRRDRRLLKAKNRTRFRTVMDRVCVCKKWQITLTAGSGIAGLRSLWPLACASARRVFSDGGHTTLSRGDG